MEGSRDDEYAQAWSEYRRRGFAWGLWFGIGIILANVDIFLCSRLPGLRSNASYVAAFTAGLVVVCTGYVRAWWRLINFHCPRCGEPFATKRYLWINDSECARCGLDLRERARRTGQPHSNGRSEDQDIS